MGPLDEPLPAPSTKPVELPFTIQDLAALRRLVLREATEASLGVERAHDLVLAMNELATNSLRHGGGAGTLRIWTEAQTLLCEVQDSRHITDPLTGSVPPTPEQPSGRGLWVVNHLCDRVQIHSSPTGSFVRVHMCLA
jgi:anti-sigma regulatory factor (Ser/Thr protein kinase)